MNWRANNGHIPRLFIGYLLFFFLGVRSRKGKGVLVMSNQDSISWGELAELTHATQVEKFNWCGCEEQEYFPFQDCPREGETLQERADRTNPYIRVGHCLNCGKVYGTCQKSLYDYPDEQSHKCEGRGKE